MSSKKPKRVECKIRLEPRVNIRLQEYLDGLPHTLYRSELISELVTDFLDGRDSQWVKRSGLVDRIEKRLRERAEKFINDAVDIVENELSEN